MSKTKNETRHSPGPWEVCRYRHLTIRVAPKPGQLSGSIIATVTGPESEANARLIASSPDLLHAVKCMKAAFVRHPGNPEERKDALIKAIAAIAKAEGKE
jgi:hypothetical protein